MATCIRINLIAIGQLCEGTVHGSIFGSAAMHGAVGAAIGVPLAFALFRRLFPNKTSPKENELTDADKQRIKRLDHRSTLLFFVVWLAATPIFWFFLHVLMGLVRHSRPTPELGFYIVGPYWLLIAMFMGMVASAYISMWLLRRRLGDDFHLVFAHENRMHGFDGLKVLPYLTIPIGVLCVLGAVQGLRYRTELLGDKILIHQLLSLQTREYAMSDVLSILTAPSIKAPNGNVVYRRIYAIHFGDGTSWNTDSVEPTLKASAEEFVGLIAARSGVTIARRTLLEQDDL